MSQSNYILNLLNIEDKNIKLMKIIYFMKNLTILFTKLLKVLLHMNHHFVVDVVVYLIKSKLMRKMVLNHQKFYCLIYVVTDVF